MTRVLGWLLVRLVDVLAPRVDDNLHDETEDQ